MSKNTNESLTAATDDPMLETAKACVIALEMVPQRMWGTLWTELKLSFHRRFSNGFISSTTHGLDYFQNVVDAIEGRLDWDEKGEYGDNFRRMIKGRPRGGNHADIRV